MILDMKKCSVFLMLFTMILVFAATSQSSSALSEAEEEIALPDVSTVISGGAPKVGKSAIPDFSEIFPSAETAEVVPRLPEPGKAEGTSSEAVILNQRAEKKLYVEGKAGLGLPAFFIGDFSIYRQTGKNPFRINFGHESANRYVWHSFSSGYFDRNTYLEAEKMFSTDKTKWVLSGKYNSVADGLQSKCDNMSDITKHELEATVDFLVNFTKNISLTVFTDGAWYNRYGNIVGSPDLQDFEESLSVFSLNPRIGFSLDLGQVHLSFDADYQLEYDIGNSLYTRDANRFDFGLDFGFKNDFMDVFADVDGVLGNRIGDNAVLVPFDVGADFHFKTSLSSRDMKVSVIGGMDSSLQKISSLEKEYKFSAMNEISTETSDWFGKTHVYFPIKDIVSISFDGEFRKTAFGNGTLFPIYEKTYFSNGQYIFISNDITQFNTDLSVQAKWGIISLVAFWNAKWVDVLPTKNPHEIGFSFNVQDKKSRVIYDMTFAVPLGKGVDAVPVWDFELSFKASNAVRLAISGADILKLMMAKSRVYAGEYVKRSGTVAALVKFFL